MNGRWTIHACLCGATADGTMPYRLIHRGNCPWSHQQTQTVPAVPCDAAAVERVVAVLGFYLHGRSFEYVRAAAVSALEAAADMDPSPSPSDPEGERLADGSRPYPKSSDSALPAPSTEGA